MAGEHRAFNPCTRSAGILPASFRPVTDATIFQRDWPASVSGRSFSTRYTKRLEIALSSGKQRTDP
ncbi:MAG: hypothetical protein WA734_15125, partial [Candidatus Acidiferrales bacterium]